MTIEAKASTGTASGKRSIASTRPTADAPVPPGCCESVTPIEPPEPRNLRRCRSWQPLPDHAQFGNALERVAYHEAGHVVVMQWLGLPSPGASIDATTAVVRGSAEWPDRSLWQDCPDPLPDESGVLAATAASVFHAGLMAELIHAGVRWVGPIHYPRATDYQRADEMLRSSFGNHASGAHAFAQQLALHVLSGMWPRVQEIATYLVTHGQWRPGPQG